MKSDNKSWKIHSCTFPRSIRVSFSKAACKFSTKTHSSIPYRTATTNSQKNPYSGHLPAIAASTFSLGARQGDEQEWRRRGGVRRGRSRRRWGKKTKGASAPAEQSDGDEKQTGWIGGKALRQRPGRERAAALVEEEEGESGGAGRGRWRRSERKGGRGDGREGRRRGGDREGISRGRRRSWEGRGRERRRRRRGAKEGEMRRGIGGRRGGSGGIGGGGGGGETERG